MYKRTITEREAGQRFDRYLRKLLPKAGSGFLYKMLRKKNIVLNDKKADGSEKLVCGDEIAVYFSDETLHKFMGEQKRLQTKADIEMNSIKLDITNRSLIEAVTVIFENEHILIADKPAGMLTQKAAPSDFSLNDWLIDYMLNKHQITVDELQTFRPSACNRLDRNTSGIVLCAKTVQGAQMLSEALRNRNVQVSCDIKVSYDIKDSYYTKASHDTCSLHKFYMLYVKGHIAEEKVLVGYLVKDNKSNKVEIYHETESNTNKNGGNGKSSYICTRYIPIKQESDKTLLEVELITGKSHQIRAHLASIGHPLLGDYKYGDKKWNDVYRKKFNVKYQLLHAYKVVFEKLDEPFEDISEREFIAPLPEVFKRVAAVEL